MLEIIVGLALAVLALLGKVKWDGRKIEKQAEEIHMFEKKAEIIEDMGLAEVKAEKKANEAIEDINTDNWRDNI